MLVVGHDHGNMAVGSIVLSVVPIGKLIGTRKSEFAGTPPLPKYYLYDYCGKMQSSTCNPDAMLSTPVFESLVELLIPRRYVMLCVGLMLMFFLSHRY